VLIIDDVDLQVERIRELLPAIRLLSRHQCLVLVAGIEAHARHAPRRFLGQRLKLVGRRFPTLNVEDAPDEWAVELARSSFQKVFQLRNQFPCGCCQQRGFCISRHESNKLRHTNRWIPQQPTNREQQERVIKAKFKAGDCLSIVLDDQKCYLNSCRIDWPIRSSSKRKDHATTRTLLRPFGRSSAYTTSTTLWQLLSGSHVGRSCIAQRAGSLPCGREGLLNRLTTILKLFLVLRRALTIAGSVSRVFGWVRAEPARPSALALSLRDDGLELQRRTSNGTSP
jgi:hypothetical protein